MRLGERILLGLSKSPQESVSKIDMGSGIDNALAALCEVFPNFLNRIKDREILDFGCGGGYQSIAMAKRGAKAVTGVDINYNSIQYAKRLARQNGVDNKTQFSSRLENSHKNRFDIVMSHNSFEHFSKPELILQEMKSALKPAGILYITFGPPWLAPYGSHTEFFTNLPWSNILFCEDTVMKVRGHFRNDGARRYEEVEGGLNKMTVKKFERIVADTDMSMQFRRYDCIKRLQLFARVPIARELFINRVSCVLAEKDNGKL